MKFSFPLRIAACGFVAALAGGAAAQQEPMKPSRAAQAVMSSDTKDFFKTAASANAFELEAARLAQQKASDPKVKEYAQRMLTDHGQAGDELQKLARDKGITLQTDLLRRHQAMLDDLRDETGHGFDNEYRMKMIVSHKESVSLFEEAARKAPDRDVQAFAAKTLAKLQQHGSAAEQLPKH